MKTCVCTVGTPLDARLPRVGRLGAVRQKLSQGSSRRLQVGPLPAGHWAPSDPSAGIYGPPAHCGWGRRPFYVRRCAIHSKPSSCNPPGQLSLPSPGLAGYHRDVALWVEGGTDAPRPHPRLPSGSWWLGEGEGPPCARVPQGRLLLLRPLFQAGAPQSQVAKGWNFWGPP